MALRSPKTTARILMVFSAVAFLTSAGIAVMFRDWPLTGFFLALCIGAAGMAAATWPNENEPP